MTVMHSVIDILGLNDVARAIFDNAAAAIAGMVRDAGRPVSGLSERSVGITMLGQTTPGVMRLREVLIEHGREPVIFHANGVGGPAMEQLVEAKALGGVIDYTLSELANTLLDGIHAPGPTACASPAGTDCRRWSCQAAWTSSTRARAPTLPERYRSRKTYFHNPVATLVRLTRG